MKSIDIDGVTVRVRHSLRDGAYIGMLELGDRRASFSCAAREDVLPLARQRVAEYRALSLRLESTRNELERRWGRLGPPCERRHGPQAFVPAPVRQTPLPAFDDLAQQRE